MKYKKSNAFMNVEAHDDDAVTPRGLGDVVLTMRWFDLVAVADVIERERAGKAGRKSAAKLTPRHIWNAAQQLAANGGSDT